MAQPATAPSLLELDLEQQFPVKLLHASQWESSSLETRVYRSSPSLEWSLKPATLEDVLGVVLKAGSTITRRVGRRTEHQPLTAGLAALIPSQAESEMRWTGTDEWFHFIINPYFKTRIANEVFDRDPKRLEVMDKFLFGDGLITQISYNLYNEMKTREPLGLVYVESMAQMLVVHLFRRYASASLDQEFREPRGHLSARTLQRIKDYVLSNIGSSLRLDDVAREVSLSAYHLSRAFRQTTGDTLYRFIIKQRIETARHLLLTTDLSLKQIALHTGFVDQSHLTNSFKGWLGVTPGELAQQHRNLQKPRKILQDV